MFSALLDIGRTDIDNRASDGLGRCDDDVVVLCHLERVKWLACIRLVEHTRIDGVGYGVVDKFTENKTISALVKELHGICGDRNARSDVWIVFQDLYKIQATVDRQKATQMRTRLM